MGRKTLYIMNISFPFVVKNVDAFLLLNEDCTTSEPVRAWARGRSEARSTSTSPDTIPAATPPPTHRINFTPVPILIRWDQGGGREGGGERERERERRGGREGARTHALTHTHTRARAHTEREREREGGGS